MFYDADYTASNGSMVGKQYVWWKEWVVEYSRYCIGIFLEKLRETTTNLSQYSRGSGRDSNRATPNTSLERGHNNLVTLVMTFLVHRILWGLCLVICVKYVIFFGDHSFFFGKNPFKDLRKRREA